MHKNLERPPSEGKPFRFACSIHLIDVLSDRFGVVTCPMCRGEFSKLGELVLEITLSENYAICANTAARRAKMENIKRDFEMPEEHHRMCVDCSCSPIVGRIYCISEADISEKIEEKRAFLCSNCFEKRIEGCIMKKLCYFWKDVSVLILLLRAIE